MEILENEKNKLDEAKQRIERERELGKERREIEKRMKQRKEMEKQMKERKDKEWNKERKKRNGETN